MSYMLHIIASTEKTKNLMDFLSADETRLKRIWPETTVSLTDSRAAGIDDISFGWFLNDMQNAQITRMQDGHYRVLADRITSTTPEVLEKLEMATNRLGHPYFGGAYFLTRGQVHSVAARLPLEQLEYDGSFDGPQGDDLTAGM